MTPDPLKVQSTPIRISMNEDSLDRHVMTEKKLINKANFYKSPATPQPATKDEFTTPASPYLVTPLKSAMRCNRSKQASSVKSN
jgi:hypothetical protein